MSDPGDVLEQAYRGEGPVFERLIARRTSELAAAVLDESDVSGGMRAVLLAKGQATGWAIPLDGLARVEEMPPHVPLPGRGAPVMGVGVLSGRRCLLVDLDCLVAGVALRSGDRPGHALLLRRFPLAMVVDRAQGVTRLPAPADKNSVPVALDGGLVWLPPDWLRARAMEEPR